MSQNYLRYGVGLDTSKSSFHVCIGLKFKSGEFKVKAQKKFKNTLKGFEEFQIWLDKHLKEDIPIKFLLEVTGVYHENLLYYLYKKGYEVCLEQGHRVKKYLSILGHKSKTDKLDGKGMSQMICEREIKRWSPVSEFILEIRTIIRHRKSMITMKVQLQNRLHAIMHSHQEIPYVVKSLEKSIKDLIKQIEESESRVMKLSQKDKDFYEKVEMIVESVNGLGYLTVLTIISETNGFESFENRKQLESYAGYDVVENSSGQYKGKTRISKRGNVNIRSVLYMGALSAVRAKASPFYEIYTRLVSRNGGIKKKANVAVQRKLLLITYTLWKKNEPFDVKYYKAA